MRWVYGRAEEAAIVLVAAFFVVLCWPLASDFAILQALNQRFELTTNATDAAAYRVNGLIVHVNDGWADIEVRERALELGYVSTSFIRRDVSKNHYPAIFFSEDFREMEWMKDDVAGTGVILDNQAAFTPLCFFATDGASQDRNLSGCGGYVAGDQQGFDWEAHYLRHGIDDVPPELAYEKLDPVPLETIYVPGKGISNCDLLGIVNAEAYDVDLMSDWRTTCSFAIDKARFALGLEFSRKFQSNYNEFVIKEWSQEENPVQAVFYVTSDSGKRVAAADSDFFRGQAIALRDRYLEKTGRRLPVFSINLDNFHLTDKPVVEYSVWANNPFSGLYLRLKAWL
jgi:hypothetical protein